VKVDISKHFITPGHGGGLNQIIKQYENSSQEKKVWLDLSTGINPNGWPVPAIPAHIFNRLPEKDDGLIEAAQAFYEAQSILPVSGSQEAIQILPLIFQRYLLSTEREIKHPKVGIVAPCYSEHEFQWKKNNFSIIHLTSKTVDEVIDELNVLVIINPNNPTGELIDVEQLLNWKARLNRPQGKRKGYLVIDEAFMDATPEKSILNTSEIKQDSLENLIVLRSVGKFFGLAGVRCGFIIAKSELLSLIEYQQGPWSVSGPTRWLVKKALQDQQWIRKNKKDLVAASIRLEKLLEQYQLKIKIPSHIVGTVLFKTLYAEHAEKFFHELATQGIFVRLLDKSCECHSCELQFKNINSQHKGLRFGLPANEEQWQRLEKAFQIKK